MYSSFTNLSRTRGSSFQAAIGLPTPGWLVNRSGSMGRQRVDVSVRRRVHDRLASPGDRLGKSRGWCGVLVECALDRERERDGAEIGLCCVDHVDKDHEPA